MLRWYVYCKNCQFPIYWVPQRVGSRYDENYRNLRPRVSNLLGSPASGEAGRSHLAGKKRRGFQFIGFPSEWGEDARKIPSLHQQVFPIYWVPQRVGRPVALSKTGVTPGFQFIGFPSEWGALVNTPNGQVPLVFPIYWVPQRVGRKKVNTRFGERLVFPIYWVPQRVGRCNFPEGPSLPDLVSNLLGSPASGEILRKGYSSRCSNRREGFQFIGFPSEWGV